MPSLRRTLSSPSVRSSPYPTTISSSISSSSSSAGSIAQGNSRRRSSGTETGSRRVLADIDWWTVTAGQVESDDQNQNDDPVVAVASFGVDLFGEDLWSDIELPVLTRQSSLASTPEMAELALPTVHPSTSAKDAILGLGLGHPSTRPPPLRPVRAHSFADVFSLHAPSGPYADFAISPLSPGLDFRN